MVLTALELEDVPLFGGVPEPARARFAALAHPIVCGAGEIVFHEGELARDIYIVADGTFDVLRRTPDGQRSVAYLQRADLFGEMGFIDMQPRSATIQARTDGHLWKWEYVALRTFYAEDPKAFTLIVMNIARELSRRLRRADDALARGTLRRD